MLIFLTAAGLASAGLALAGQHCPRVRLHHSVDRGCRGAPDPAQEGERKGPETGFFQTLVTQPHLTGDWGGARTALSNHGLVLNASFGINVATNPASGNQASIAQTNSTGVDLSLDMEKLLGATGLLFFSSFAYRQGDSLSEAQFPPRPTDRGGPIPVSFQQMYGGQTWHLIYLFVQQTVSLFHDRDFSIKVGRLAQFQDFVLDDGVQYYMNNAFDGQPQGFFKQGVFYAYPGVTWGGVAQLGVPLGEQQGLFAKLGAYGTTTDADPNGVNFTPDFDRGVNLMAEVGYKRNWRAGNTGLPLKALVGGWYTSGNFPTWQGSSQPIGGGYFFATQAVFIESRTRAANTTDQAIGAEVYWGEPSLRVGRLQGLFVWATGEFSLPSTAAMDQWFEVGAHYRGLVPGRNEDVTAIAFYTGFFSQDLRDVQEAASAPPQTYEAGLELGYRAYLTPYLYLQPNLQWIFNPGGSHQYEDAFVVGLQSVVDL